MLGFVKGYLKASPLYPYYFARKNALPSRLSDDELRCASLYAPFVHTGSLVFDVGANIGVRSKVFLHLHCRVVAIEPQRNCVAALRRSFGRSVEIVKAAVSDHAGEMDLHVSDFSLISSLSEEWMSATRESGRFPGMVWDKTERVRLVTLDSLIAQFGVPDFIKIDIEGHELPALRGLNSYVPGISFELTPEVIGIGEACIDKLEQLGRYEYNFSPNETATFEFEEWLDPDRMVAFFQSTDRFGDVFARALGTA